MDNIKHIVAKDLRLNPKELSKELSEYILQFIPEEKKTDEVLNCIEKDSYEFTLKCLFNFRQR